MSEGKKLLGKNDSARAKASRSGNPAKAAAAERERLEASRAAANRVSSAKKMKKISSPSWYAPTMVALMIVGLLWIVVTYLFQGRYPIPYFTQHHGADWLVNGNLYIGFVVIIAGFLGLLRWK